MKKVTVKLGSIILLTFLALTIACDTGIVGNGNVESRTEDVRDFTRVVIGGNFDVFITQGNKTELRFELDENIYEILKIRESGRTLTIETDLNIIRAKKKEIYLTVREIDKLDFNGAVDLQGSGIIETGSLTIISSGAAKMDLELKTNRLRLDLSGAVDCNIQGKTGELEVSLSGAGDLNAIDMIAEKVNLDLSGAGHARVFASDELEVSISGIGSVRYRGDPAIINKNISGLGSLKRD